ncbi:MAG: helix-turn-helix domain containing protein [Aeromicrobium sp.]|uniref:TetR/AcrR family transcriptional regulator n=1 Tax=Aeromicrobium sp. TaxID=1871063 RepID=UPI0026060920|nr:TetR/AcrR family transcriptional regulator [Aeromicrobium sp.]MDF1705092.1 helix-turn-helix domain containing protein [Aeromicrobium sp.]
MGLRETNATRTRTTITEAAMALFLQRGYEATTMEDVAEAAEVGLSTLYRYFPSKDLLGTAYLTEPERLAELLLARPADEPTEEALGRALVELVTSSGEEPVYTGRVRDLIQQNPRLHGRLLDWLLQTHVQLTAALAHRRGAPADDIVASVLSWTAVLVLERASDRLRTRHDTSVPDAVREVIAELEQTGALAPRLPRP